MPDYQFTQDWFSHNVSVWSAIFAGNAGPVRAILEIGAYEGRATVWLIENVLAKVGDGTIVAVDAWIDDGFADPSAPGVLARFRHNVDLAVRRAGNTTRVEVLKGLSHRVLPGLLAGGRAGTFDLIYVDGSHRAPDVLSDLVFAYHLCRTGGLIFCDDYLWSSEAHGAEDLTGSPKLAIDAFVNCYRRKVRMLIGMPLYQIYLEKTGD